MDASPEQLAEYEKQLADVVELIQASPEDESLLSLKTDLEELVALTRDTLAAAGEGAAGDAAAVEQPTEAKETEPTLELPSARVADAPPPIGTIQIQAAAPTADQGNTATDNTKPTKKKKKLKKEFEVPANLVISATDTEKEQNRKKRAIKQLKRKHTAAVKEEESNQKQKSWQNFNKKKKSKKEGSIFSTHDGDSKVGVVGARNVTTFGERKRHK